MRSHTIIMTEKQVKIAIRILDKHGGYCGVDEEELYDLTALFKSCLIFPVDVKQRSDDSELPIARYICRDCNRCQTFDMMAGEPLIELPCKCGNVMRLVSDAKPVKESE